MTNNPENFAQDIINTSKTSGEISETNNVNIPKMIKKIHFTKTKKLPPVSVNPIDLKEIDKDLQDHDYTLLDTVIIKDNNKEITKYIKCFNSFGDICFVDVSEVTNFKVVFPNKSVLTLKEGDEIPFNNISPIQEASESKGINNLVFNSDNGTYYTINKNNGKNVVNKFVVLDKLVNKTIAPLHSLIAYPIITFAEIIANNNLILKRVREATEKIQEKSYSYTINITNDVISNSTKLHNAIIKTRDAFKNDQMYRLEEQHVILKILETIKFKQEQKQANEKDIENSKILANKLYNLNLEFVKLSETINEFNKISASILHDYELSRDTFWFFYIEALSKNYSLNTTIKGKLREYVGKLKNTVRFSKYWGLPQGMDFVSYDQLIENKLPKMVGTKQEIENLEELKRVVSTYYKK